MSRPQPAPAECAICGADVPPAARACPSCGADERTGWREQSLYDGLDLPNSAWADDDAPAPSRPPALRGPAGLAWYWWALAVLLLFCFGFAVLGLS